MNNVMTDVGNYVCNKLDKKIFIIFQHCNDADKCEIKDCEFKPKEKVEEVIV